MSLNRLQQQVYENKVRRSFNITDVGSEIILMTEELGELSDAYIDEDAPGLKDAFGDLMIYCLGLSSMFSWNADTIFIKNPHFKRPPRDALDYIPYLTKEVGMIAKNYKKSNKEPVNTINRREEFQHHLGNLMGYCISGIEFIGEDPPSVLESIINNNVIRTHEGQI